MTTQRRTRTRRRLELGGSVGIAQTGELHERLVALLKGRGAVAMDLSAVERLDTAAAQLLTAFLTAAHAKGMPLKWQAPVSDAVRTTLERVGLRSAWAGDEADALATSAGATDAA